MSDSENICLACGLCCDGTLIGFVQLEREELPRLKKLMEIEEIQDDGVILHPCNSFCERCTIYDERPKQCISFNCQLLKAVEQKEVPFKTATDIIAKVKEMKTSVQTKIKQENQIKLKSESFYFQMVELKNVFNKLEATSSLTASQSLLAAEYEELNLLITENFGISLYKKQR